MPRDEATLKRMKAQRRADTQPEMAIRRQLHRRGMRFRVNYSPAGGPTRRRADVAFTRLRVAVFVDGCFWHSCPLHGTLPRTNSEWWKAKLRSNVQRDRDTDAQLEAIGWLVVRIWEHEPPEVGVERVLQAIEMRRGSVT